MLSPPVTAVATSAGGDAADEAAHECSRGTPTAQLALLPASGSSIVASSARIQSCVIGDQVGIARGYLSTRALKQQPSLNCPCRVVLGSLAAVRLPLGA